MSFFSNSLNLKDRRLGSRELASGNVGTGRFLSTVFKDQLSNNIGNVLLQKYKLMERERDEEDELLSPEQASEEYGMDGELVFEEPIRRGAANYLYSRKIDEVARASLMRRGSSGFRMMLSFPVALAASFLDPIEVGAALIPVAGWVGKTRIGMKVLTGGSRAARIGMKAGMGFAEGAVGTAFVEPARALLLDEFQSNYTIEDSLIGIALGGALGGGMGVVGGSLGKLAVKGKKAELLQEAVGSVLDDKVPRSDLVLRTEKSVFQAEQARGRKLTDTELVDLAEGRLEKIENNGGEVGARSLQSDSQKPADELFPVNEDPDQMAFDDFDSPSSREADALFDDMATKTKEAELEFFEGGGKFSAEDTFELDEINKTLNLTSESNQAALMSGVNCMVGQIL